MLWILNWTFWEAQIKANSLHLVLFNSGIPMGKKTATWY